MIRTLEIEWEHSPDLDEVPVITSDTKKTFCGLLRELRPAFEREGIILRFASMPITGPAGRQCRVTLNGRLLGDLIMEVAEEQRLCEGRRCEMNIPVSFPDILMGNIQYRSVPDLILRKVFLRACGII
jgi:hypothetical protein